jgi:hypothetical protein
MIRTRFKNVLLVAPDVFPDQLLVNYPHVKQVSAFNSIFPAIYQFNPDLIILDYDFMGVEMEKTVRRIKANKFYDKIKICCYKNKPGIKAEGLLKAIGVDHFIYKEDLAKTPKNSKVLNAVHSILDISLLKWGGSVTG